MRVTGPNPSIGPLLVPKRDKGVKAELNHLEFTAEHDKGGDLKELRLYCAYMNDD